MKDKNSFNRKVLYYSSILFIVLDFLLAIFLKEVIEFSLFNLTKVVGVDKIKTFLYVTQIPFTVVLILILLLCKDMKDRKQFSMRTVSYLNWIILSCVVEIFLYFAAFIYSGFISMLFVIASITVVVIFTSIIKQIIVDGIEYYEDSKGTI